MTTIFSQRKRISTASILAVLIAAVLVLSGCQSVLSDAHLPDDGPPPNVSQEAARRFIEKAVNAAQTTASDGRFTLTVTQEEATSFLAIGADIMATLQGAPPKGTTLEQLRQRPELQGIEDNQAWQDLMRRWQQETNRLPVDLAVLRTLIEDPRVYFRSDGQITVRGYVTILGQRQPVRMVTAPYIANGEISLEFVEGQFGRLPASRWLFNLVGRGVAQALVLTQDYATLDVVQVNEGTLTIQGPHSLN